MKKVMKDKIDPMELYQHFGSLVIDGKIRSDCGYSYVLVVEITTKFSRNESLDEVNYHHQRF